MSSVAAAKEESARNRRESFRMNDRVALQVRIYSGHRPSERLLADHAYELHRHVWRMEVDFDQSPGAAIGESDIGKAMRAERDARLRQVGSAERG